MIAIHSPTHFSYILYTINWNLLKILKLGGSQSLFVESLVFNKLTCKSVEKECVASTYVRLTSFSIAYFTSESMYWTCSRNCWNKMMFLGIILFYMTGRHVQILFNFLRHLFPRVCFMRTRRQIYTIFYFVKIDTRFFF